MADTEIQAILGDLLARGDLSGETRVELEDFQAQAQSGQLDATDRDYVLALARRLTGKSIAAAAEGEAADPYDEEHSWRERAAEAEQRAAAAEAKLVAVRAAFERMYGPETIDASADADVRREIYEGFSAELSRIEQSEG